MSSSSKLRLFARYALLFAAVMAVVLLIALGFGFFAVRSAYNSLPALDAMTDYRPKIPLRVYTSDGKLIGEFGEERRSVSALKDIPTVMQKAVLAAEDDRFYEHGGVDMQGIARAAINNLRGGARQGASTITQQVARNFFLTREQTFKRKFYEALLAWKIESNMSKDQILEVYMNQIYLGQRAYGFASASQIYFRKNIAKVTLAEAAMLAGLPKAPSSYNPVANPKRARERQAHILNRMRSLGYIDSDQYRQAMDEKLVISVGFKTGGEFGLRAEYAAEMARQFAVDMFKEDAYTRGINIYTTISKEDQEAAYAALRRGVLAYDRAHGYRGPEAQLTLPDGKARMDEMIEQALAERPDSDGILAAVVLEAGPKALKAALSNGDVVEVGPEGLAFVAHALSDKTPSERRVRRGSVIRLSKNEAGRWEALQMPEVASAFVAANTRDGSIRALVGGFDFNLNKFNRVAQAWRQPGSSFKPFIYSASLEKGLSPATLINDAPFFASAGPGSPVWSPKNYDGKNEGPITMRRGLTFSKNLVSVRIIDRIGPKYAQEYATRFGFDAERNPPFLTLALGSGAVTPLQMAGAYSVFANGGYKVEPYLVAKAVDANGKTLYLADPLKAGEESNRAIDERNAFIMDSMLKDVAQKGTAAKASALLKRQDLAGKTGTTNDSFDAWFSGYHPKIVGVAWIGFDQPKSLGSRETGGGVALPIWIDYMKVALKNEPPTAKREIPDGVLQANGDYYLAEFGPGSSVRSLGISAGPAAPKADPDEDPGEKLPQADESQLF